MVQESFLFLLLGMFYYVTTPGRKGIWEVSISRYGVILSSGTGVLLACPVLLSGKVAVRWCSSC